LWKVGNTNTQRIGKNRNITNISTEDVSENDDINKIINYMGKIETKIDLPVGKKAYYKSRNIKLPKTKTMTYKEACMKMGDNYDLQSEDTQLIINNKNGNVMNKIKNEYWKKNKGGGSKTNNKNN
jgi:hypothetical protein